MALETVTLENTDERLTCHLPIQCRGEICCIHNRTDHCMRNFAQHWRSDRGIMERICPHGVGHPDPDDWQNTDTVHGCCVPPCCGSLDDEFVGDDLNKWKIKYVKAPSVEGFGEFSSELSVADWEGPADPTREIAELRDALGRALKSETEKKTEIRRLIRIMESRKALLDGRL